MSKGEEWTDEFLDNNYSYQEFANRLAKMVIDEKPLSQREAYLRGYAAGSDELRKYNLDLAAENQEIKALYDKLREDIHADVCDLLDALNLPVCARPYSQHEVITRDIIPAIADIVYQARQ